MPSVKSVATAGICALLLLSACSTAENKLESSALTADQTKLGDALFAFYLSAQVSGSKFGSDKRKPAYVVLVQPDGSYQTVKTHGMDGGKLAWSEAGLYFSDDKRDYLLHDNGLTTFPNPKMELQQAAVALPDGKGFIATYNDGTGQPGQVVVTTASASRLYQVDGYYFSHASCNGVIYGISQLPNAHFAESARLPGMRSKSDPSLPPEMLARLYPAAGDGQEEVIGWRPAFNASANGLAPCEQGMVTFLSTYDDADGQPHTVVVSWDTATGSYVEHPMVDETGQPIQRAALEFATHDGGSLRDGKLEWYGVGFNGYIMATDINTGVTTRRFATGYDPEKSQDTHVLFTDESIYALNEPQDSKKPLTFKQFDRATGKVVKSLTLTGIREHISLDLLIRGLAVRPPA